MFNSVIYPTISLWTSATKARMAVAGTGEVEIAGEVGPLVQLGRKLVGRQRILLQLVLPQPHLRTTTSGWRCLIGSKPQHAWLRITPGHRTRLRAWVTVGGAPNTQSSGTTRGCCQRILLKHVPPQPHPTTSRMKCAPPRPKVIQPWLHCVRRQRSRAQQNFPQQRHLPHKP